MPQQPKKLTPSRGPLDLFGAEVRHHRERAGLSLRALADLIPYAASTIGEIERGEAGCDLVFAEHCDQILNTDGALARLHEGLFDGRAAAFPDYFAGWPDRESEAETLRSYQMGVIDGLLQTRDYAGALLRGDEKAIQSRMNRQDILTRPNPPRLMVVMPEVVLWNKVGTAELMYEQLMHLADVISPMVSVQIIPNGAPHLGHLGSFVVARLSGGCQVAYREAEPHGSIVEARDEIDALHEKFSDLATYALPVDMSGALIRETAESKWKT
ncbi:helix-turn-helix domain-containing protein [Actinomadura kijaniata]|uniref:helix-turn-helix domain-containing protein n=1 Tax=Actinomadura kijaniata TaxID=46161 RepID=UPI000A706B02|nr:helix-turn-helix transcriptional regulator [Actinomadura kijaniata]